MLFNGKYIPLYINEAAQINEIKIFVMWGMYQIESSTHFATAAFQLNIEYEIKKNKVNFNKLARKLFGANVLRNTLLIVKLKKIIRNKLRKNIFDICGMKNKLSHPTI